MQRVIFLVDMNAFFIGCEMARNPGLKGKPAAVAGDPKYRSGIILAANYEARKFGVKTTMVLHEARKLCPDILLVPPDHGYYEKKSREVMAILARYSPVIQQNSIDEAWIDLTGCEALFGRPVDIARKIMKDIMDELDLWCSVGISDNKFLAKMGSELKKPLGITELWLSDIGRKLWPLPVRDMYGVGKQTGKRLNDMAIFTIGDLAHCEVELLRRAFGKYGDELHQLANGIDPSPVTEHPHHDSRSISRSTTLVKDTTDVEHAANILLRLAEGVGAEARRSGCKGKTVSIAIKYSDFKTITRQKSIAPTYLTRDIYGTGMELLKENWNVHRPVRLLGIGLGNIDESGDEQLSLFDVMGDNGKTPKKTEKLEKAVDAIREKFGSEKISRAVTMRDE